MAGDSCQRIKDLTYQKQVQIYSNWENEIMPEKTVKRAKNTLQKKHRAFNKPTRKIFLKFTQEFHLFVKVTSKRQSFSPLSLSLLFLPILIFICPCACYLHIYTFKQYMQPINAKRQNSQQLREMSAITVVGTVQLKGETSHLLQTGNETSHTVQGSYDQCPSGDFIP